MALHSFRFSSIDEMPYIFGKYHELFSRYLQQDLEFRVFFLLDWLSPCVKELNRFLLTRSDPAARKKMTRLCPYLRAIKSKENATDLPGIRTCLVDTAFSADIINSPHPHTPTRIFYAP